MLTQDHVPLEAKGTALPLWAIRCFTLITSSSCTLLSHVPLPSLIDRPAFSLRLSLYWALLHRTPTHRHCHFSHSLWIAFMTSSFSPNQCLAPLTLAMSFCALTIIINWFMPCTPNKLLQHLINAVISCLLRLPPTHSLSMSTRGIWDRW